MEKCKKKQGVTEMAEMKKMTKTTEVKGTGTRRWRRCRRGILRLWK